MDLDITKNYVLCFGEDERCKANLAFMIGYLKNRGYAKAIKVQILNEYDLDLLKKYSAD